MLERSSFIDSLLKNMADMIKIEEESGKDTFAAIQEVNRQIRQVSRQNGGDPMTGEGITKSGEED